jgi:hypothetical protein
MKYLSLFLLMMVAAACQQAPRQSIKNEAVVTSSPTGNFGNEFSADNTIPATGVANLFTGSDTAAITISGNITASCKHSGCWMDLDMGNGETIHVTFKDEAFTIPLDAAGKNAVAEGIAIRELIPVETLKNYAREDGKSDEEVAAITQPVYAYEFVANGVLIEE